MRVRPATLANKVAKTEMKNMDNSKDDMDNKKDDIDNNKDNNKDNMYDTAIQAIVVATAASSSMGSATTVTIMVIERQIVRYELKRTRTSSKEASMVNMVHMRMIITVIISRIR